AVGDHHRETESTRNGMSSATISTSPDPAGRSSCCQVVALGWLMALVLPVSAAYAIAVALVSREGDPGTLDRTGLSTVAALIRSTRQVRGAYSRGNGSRPLSRSPVTEHPDDGGKDRTDLYCDYEPLRQVGSVFAFLAGLALLPTAWGWVPAIRLRRRQGDLLWVYWPRTLNAGPSTSRQSLVADPYRSAAAETDANSTE
ncbi:MAG: hypothetical protein QOG10_2148, partial [Kribbellaceae bacterium]|nr:hypothetical protein [Kribbellaceae bacterium]